MDFIDNCFNYLSSVTSNNLPSGVFTDLLSQGIIPGLGGIVIFIPQLHFISFVNTRRNWLHE